MTSAKKTGILIAFLTASMIVYCIADETSAKTPPTDTSDPEAVAKAFITALANTNVQEAALFILPEERGELTKELQKGLPPLPSDPKIRVRVKKDGVRADVSILNAKRPKSGPPLGLDMKLVKGKWWIVK